MAFYFNLDGLDISRQTFRGGISLVDDVHYSQGALQYSEFVITQVRKSSTFFKKSIILTDLFTGRELLVHL